MKNITLLPRKENKMEERDVTDLEKRVVDAVAEIKEQVVNIIHRVAGMIPGWELPREYVAELYDQLPVTEEEVDLRGQVDRLGDAVKCAFFRRFSTYYKYKRANDSLFRANAADRFIRRLDWNKSYERGRLTKTNGCAVY